MLRLRSLLVLCLSLVSFVLVSCGAPEAVAPPTYSPEKIAQIQLYAVPVEGAREKMETLRTLISDQNWVDTRTFIHGPLGQLRQDMLGLSRMLLPNDQPRAAALAKELFGDLERLDSAAKDRSLNLAAVQYQEALEDLDAFLELIPQAS
ncbi:MAG: photosystem II protein PsbQ [Cyanobacteriota bacterium]|jgi:photosystem II protein PsbQ